MCCLGRRTGWAKCSVGSLEGGCACGLDGRCLSAPPTLPPLPPSNACPTHPAFLHTPAELLARRTPGFSGAELANLVNESALLAARHDSDTITTQVRLAGVPLV